MQSKFISTLCLSHYSFSFFFEASTVTFLILQSEETVTQYFYRDLCTGYNEAPDNECEITPFPSQQHKVAALFLCVRAAGACRGHISLADRPEAVSDSNLIQDAPQPPASPLMSGHGKEVGGGLLCLTYSRALCTFDPHYPTVCLPLCILITLCAPRPAKGSCFSSLCET